MKALLLNGSTREVGVGGPTMGLGMCALTFSSDDLRKLLAMGDAELRDYLSILSTRFVAQKVLI